MVSKTQKRALLDPKSNRLKIYPRFEKFFFGFKFDFPDKYRKLNFFNIHRKFKINIHRKQHDTTNLSDL